METSNSLICQPHQLYQPSISSDDDGIQKRGKRQKVIRRSYDVKIGFNDRFGIEMCVSLSHDMDQNRSLMKIWKAETPVAVLSIIGGSNQYMPNKTIKNQLKHGLLEIMDKINIWIITDGKDTGVGKIVEELPKYKDKCRIRVFHKISKTTTTYENKELKHPENALETCFTDHLKIPIIAIIIGGEKHLFQTALKYLMMDYPVLIIDVYGNAADAISEGYRMSMHKTSGKNGMFSEMTESAKNGAGFDDNTETNARENYEKHADERQNGLERILSRIYVHSMTDATDTLDRKIEGILFKILCEGDKADVKIIDKIIHHVDLWNRSDIAEKEIFNLDNTKVLKKLENNLCQIDSKLSKLFMTALVDNRVEIVKQVLEFIQNKTLYRTFLEKNLEKLYTNSGCTAGNKISQLEGNIITKINATVMDILGSRDLKPFKDSNGKAAGGADTNNCILEEDIFKHFFIWAVLMDRRELAIFFWNTENNDYICSALYASSLAKRLAENSYSAEFMDQKAALMESSRYYEDLAYNVTTELYCIDKDETRKLLVTEMKRYNSITILGIANKFTLMKFMGHAAGQKMLNKIWMGGISSNTSNLKAITAAFIPILIMYVTTTKKENKVKPEESNGGKLTAKLYHWMIQIYNFYKSPMIKCLFHLLTYMVMLVIFCLFILTDLHPMSEKNPSIYEYIVFAWAASLMTEELRQAFVIKQVSRNLMTWFSFWTLFEILMYSMFLTSVFLRLTLSAESFYHARMIYAITLGLFIVNSMQFFLVSKHIGPKVIMIGRMMYDIFFFIFIFAVFVFGFGIIYQATMYPNSTPGFQLFKEIIYMPYWQLYGELFLDQFEGKEPSPCTNDVSLYLNGTIARCPEVNQINTLLLAIYMVVTHIILVNILIAMFTNTFEKVQDNNELVWKFHRYSLILEYYDRSSLVPPLIIISHIRRIFMFIYNKCRDKGNKNNKFSLEGTDIPNKLEEKAVYNYFNLPLRLKRSRAKNIETEKDGFEASYAQETYIDLQEKLELLSYDVDSMQHIQIETLDAVNNMKRKLLIIELPRSAYSQP